MMTGVKRTFPPTATLVPLCGLLLAVAAPLAATPVSPVPGHPAEASYQFVLAKSLDEEGDLAGASVAFERALELDPGASYVRLEFAQMLARWARFQPEPEIRRATLERAVREVGRAASELDRNLDALRAEGDVRLALLSEDENDAAALAAAVETLEALRVVAPGDLPSLFTLGQLYQRRQRPREAAEVFEALVAASPGYPPVYPLLAQALLDSGQADRAEEPLRRVLENQPNHDAARVALADILSRRGDHRQAVAVLRAAPEGLKAPEARTRLVTESYFSGDLEGALAELDALPARQAASRYLRLVRGLVLAALGNNAEALGLLEPLLADGGPVEPDVAATVARLLAREGRAADAVRTLQNHAERLAASGAADRALAAEVQLASFHAEQKDWPAAEALLSRLAPELAGAGSELARAARLLAADVAVEQGKAAEALGLLTPEDGSKRLEVLVRSGRGVEAAAELRRLEEPGQEDALLAAVEAFHRAKDFSTTLAPLERLVASRPDRVLPRFLLGAAFERTGQAERAMTVLEELVTLDPEFHPALNYLGYLWIDRGEKVEPGIALVQRALAIDPANGAYRDSLGWGYYRQGRWEDARRELEHATRLMPDATVFEHLGDTHRALGDLAAARRAYQRARELGAEDPSALDRKLSDLDAGRHGAPRN
jgi:tetratricopeptide (TPR) repeat protein